MFTAIILVPLPNMASITTITIQIECQYNEVAKQFIIHRAISILDTRIVCVCFYLFSFKYSTDEYTFRFIYNSNQSELILVKIYKNNIHTYKLCNSTYVFSYKKFSNSIL